MMHCTTISAQMLALCMTASTLHWNRKPKTTTVLWAFGFVLCNQRHSSNIEQHTALWYLLKRLYDCRLTILMWMLCC